jgi:hypothetical protein
MHPKTMGRLKVAADFDRTSGGLTATLCFPPLPLYGSIQGTFRKLNNTEQFEHLSKPNAHPCVFFVL